MRPLTTVLAALFLTLLTVPAVRAQDCACPVPEDTVGVVWHGDRALTLREIVERVAPVLWFSPDEPLVRRGIPVPTVHPCDRPAAGPVVYYQVASLFHRGDALPEPLEGVADFTDRVRTLRLRFFFYYPEDHGMHGHRHDVEGCELELDFERGPGACRIVRLERVIAFAHGAPEYSNRLRVTEDTRLPITLLVEEGKHASCTDRNADGSYTPSYDVNQQVRDAWGVRDIFGSGYMLGAAYSSKMTKPRRLQERVLPPVVTESSGCRMLVDPSIVESEPALGRYELRAGDSLDVCAGLGTPAESTFFARGMMIANGFGVSGRVEQYEYDFEPHVSRAERIAALFTSVNLVLDEGRLHVSLTGHGRDLGEGWLVPRVGFAPHYASVDLVFTPTAVVWASPYVLGGWEYHRDEPGGGHRRNEFASEVGMKFRIALPPGKLRWPFLGQRFGGLRFGLRTNGFEKLRDQRFVIAIGGGKF